MTQLVSPFEGEPMNPENPDQEPHPTPEQVRGSGAFEVGQDTAEIYRYPDLYFEIDSKPFEPSQGITSTSIDRCYRASMKALAQARPEFKQFTERPYAEKQERVVHSFLTHSKKYGGRYMQPKQFIKESDVTKAIADQLGELEQQNHPIAQLLRTLRDQYSANMKDDELFQLTAKIVKATRHQEIVRSLRKLLPES